MSNEIFAHINSYNSILLDLSIKSPMHLWNSLVDEVLPAAYTSIDRDILHRLYAFSEWCLGQEQQNENEPAKHLTTCVTICFYENLLSNNLALADIPNWFSLEEAEEKFIANPYMSFMQKLCVKLTRQKAK